MTSEILLTGVVTGVTIALVLLIFKNFDFDSFFRVILPSEVFGVLSSPALESEFLADAHTVFLILIAVGALVFLNFFFKIVPHLAQKILSVVFILLWPVTALSGVYEYSGDIIWACFWAVVTFAIVVILHIPIFMFNVYDDYRYNYD